MFLQTQKKPKTLGPLFTEGFLLPQGQTHLEVAVYFLPLSSQKFLVEKFESTSEPPSDFERGTSVLGIVHIVFQ